MSLAIRNNNPLNIRRAGQRWQGECPPEGGAGFCRFISMDYGFRAAFVLLFAYMRRHHLYTIEQIISRWAPPSENNTSAYIEHVCRMTGIGGQELLTVTDPRLPDLVWVMAQIEAGSGIRAYKEDLARGYELSKHSNYYLAAMQEKLQLKTKTAPL